MNHQTAEWVVKIKSNHTFFGKKPTIYKGKKKIKWHAKQIRTKKENQKRICFSN